MDLQKLKKILDLKKVQQILSLKKIRNLMALKELYEKIGGDKWIPVFKKFLENLPSTEEIKGMFKGMYIKDFIKSKWAWITIAALACATFSAIYFSYYAPKTTANIISKPPSVTRKASPEIDRRAQQRDDNLEKVPDNGISNIERYCQNIIRQYNSLWVERTTGQLIDQDLIREYDRCKKLFR